MEWQLSQRRLYLNIKEPASEEQSEDIYLDSD